MAAYYNEFDQGAAAWLRELIKRGLIADGEVDERSILDVSPDDLSGFTQCHFFAGIGGWSYALRLAGWGDDCCAWTGSPPCQPFSLAGRQFGKDDPRHLAPHFVSLVRACRPPVLFGEQVASSDVFGKAASRSGKQVAGSPQWAWFDDLSDRLEAARYAVGASDIPAAGVEAPHIRQRTFFGAVRLGDDIGCDGRWQQRNSLGSAQGESEGEAGEWKWVRADLADDGAACGLDNCEREGLERHSRDGDGGGEPGRIDADEIGSVATAGADVGLADSNSHGCDTFPLDRERSSECDAEPCSAEGRTNAPDSPWSDADWLYCRDGKWRPVEPGTFPLAHGVSARVVRLRGYGNAIVPQAAAEFVRAFSEAAFQLRLPL